MNPATEASQFLTELRKRVELKTGGSGSPEKTLLDAFKYFDLNGTGTADKKAFLQVMKIRMGITSRSEEDLERLFAALSDGGKMVNYRELISRVFDSKMNLSLREPPLPPDPALPSRDKAELMLNEEQTKKTIDYMVYKLRGSKLNAFFNVLREFKAAESAAGELSQGGLSVGLKRLGIDVSPDEVQRLFYYLAGDKGVVQIDRFLELLTKNFSAERRRLVHHAYAKFDYLANGKVSLQLVKELFNSKNTFAAREGRLSAEEVSSQFAELLDGFIKIQASNFVVDLPRFEQLFSFVSGYLKEDKEFAHFVDNCFRYSDLPQPIGSTKQVDKSNTAKLDELSIKTAGLDDLFRLLTEQLNQKGNRAYIQFYKVLKCNDYDNDGFVFEKEFEKSIAESRLQFNPKQTSRLFEKFAVLRQRLDFHELMNRLVPEFGSDKRSMLREVWEWISPGAGPEVLFEQVVSNFHARNHPDFRNGHRPDYEIASEFSEGLKAFLNMARGTFLKVSEANLVRFFEFFARNWTPQYLQSVLESGFKLKGKGSVKSVGISAPYGTLPEDTPVKSRPQQRGGKEDSVGFKVGQGQSQPQTVSQQSKLLEEYSSKQRDAPQPPANPDQIAVDPFRKKVQEYKFTAPFFMENKENSKQNEEVGKRSNGLTESRQESPNGRPAGPKADDRRDLPNNRPPKADSRPELILESNIQIQEARADPPIQEQFLHKSTPSSVKQSGVAGADNESLKSKVVPPTAEAAQEKLARTLRFLGRIPMILQLEYDLTERSDERGFVDFDIFGTTLEKYELLKGMSQEERQLLFTASTVEPGKLHVQNFANKLRGQMSQVREREMISIFDRISGGQAELPMFVLRNAFLPQKFRFHAYKTMTESRDMFGGLLGLFEKLNLAVKDKDSFTLDDFLYLCDNFSFFISAEDDFLRLMSSSFK